MSCYEWEKGEFKLPSSEWSGFKASIRDAVNKSNAEMYEAAIKVHGALTARLKGMRGPDIHGIAWEEAEKVSGRAGLYSSPRFGESEIMAIVDSIVDRQFDSGKMVARVRKPQKKDFPQHGNNVTAFSGSECDLSFDNATRIASWRVDENNHACERARETPLGRALFAAVKKIRWTRGTYGRVWGNNEYNRDSGYDSVGGGGSFEKETFGPEQDRLKAQMAASRPAYGSFRRW